MNKIIRLLRYDWPLHFILLITNWLPDNVPFLRLRGHLARSFLGRCGRNLRIGRNLVFYNPSQIILGDNVYIAYGTWIAAGSEIILEDEVTIGPYCVISSSTHKRDNCSYFNSGFDAAPVKIKKGCWLGSHCVITAGCSIGPGSVLGAGAVCTTDVPENVLAAGVPAIKIKDLSAE